MIKRTIRHKRKTINEINMVPFIDVMLVLLIIFMVTAPLITPSLIDLPKVGSGIKQPPVNPIQIIVKENKPLTIKANGSTQTTDIGNLAIAIHQAQQQQAATTATKETIPVVISAEKSVAYEKVIEVMDKLQQANIERIGLLVKVVAN